MVPTGSVYLNFIRVQFVDDNHCLTLEVVSRYRNPQLQAIENLCDLQNLSPNIYHCLKIKSIIYFQQMVIRELVKTQNVYCSRHQCAKG